MNMMEELTTNSNSNADTSNRTTLETKEIQTNARRL